MKNLIHKSLVLRLSICVAFIAVFTFPLWCQTFYGAIIGTVTDASGATVPGATVTLTNLGTSDRRTAVTDATGSYQFVNLIPGRYRVDIEISGFSRFTREPVVVEVQSAVRIDASLQVGDISQVVEVAALTPLLETERHRSNMW